MLAWKMENTYQLEAPIQALAGQIFFLSDKARVQGKAYARLRFAVPSCVPLPMFYINAYLVCAWAL